MLYNKCWFLNDSLRGVIVAAVLCRSQVTHIYANTWTNCEIFANSYTNSTTFILRKRCKWMVESAKNVQFSTNIGLKLEVLLKHTKHQFLMTVQTSSSCNFVRVLVTWLNQMLTWQRGTKLYIQRHLLFTSRNTAHVKWMF